ncbi:hypothetical protein Holit_00681 [Hollandina sp. SP2]
MYIATFTVGQEAVARYYSVKDDKAAQQGSVLAALVNGIYYAFIPTLLGVITLALVNMGEVSSDTILARVPGIPCRYWSLFPYRKSLWGCCFPALFPSHVQRGIWPSGSGIYFW